MNLKSIYVSTGVLTILAAITYFVNSVESSRALDNRVGEVLVNPSSLRDVRSISLQADDQSLTLTHSSSTSKWHLAESFNLPVSMTKLGQLVTKLTESRLERVASSNSERIETFGFNGDRIKLGDADGKAITTIELGRETDTGKQLIRFAEEDIAFLINDQITLDSNPVAWLDKVLLSYERDDVLSAKLKFADGTSIALSRPDPTSNWTTTTGLPDGKELDQAAVGRAVSRFSNTSFTNVSAKDADDVSAARANSVEVELGLANENVLKIQIGRRPEVKVMKEVETENEEGETVTETKEEIETPAGPVYFFAESLLPTDPVNEYMDDAAFEVASYLLTSLPASIDNLLKDKPQPEPEIPTEEIESNEG